MLTRNSKYDILKTVKGGAAMARKTFNTSVEETILEEFKQKCENAQPKLPYSTVLEILMDWYNKGNLEVKTIVEFADKVKD